MLFTVKLVLETHLVCLFFELAHLRDTPRRVKVTLIEELHLVEGEKNQSLKRHKIDVSKVIIVYTILD